MNWPKKVVAKVALAAFQACEAELQAIRRMAIRRILTFEKRGKAVLTMV